LGNWGQVKFLIDKSSQADGNTVYAAAKELTAEHVEAAEKKFRLKYAGYVTRLRLRGSLRLRTT
jgi:hypothetical protein